MSLKVHPAGWCRVNPRDDVLSFRLDDFPVRDHVPLLITPEHAWAELPGVLADSREAREIQRGMERDRKPFP